MMHACTTPLIISLHDARHAYFRHQGQVHSISLCTPDQFRAFIASITPVTFTDQDARFVLAQQTLDDFDRWFVLSVLEKRLVTSGQALPLYTDKTCEKRLTTKYDISKPRVFQTATKNATRDKSEGAKVKTVQLVVKKRVRTAKRVLSKTNIAS